MKSILPIIILLIMVRLCPMACAQNAVDVIPLIHSAITKTGSDDISNERQVLKVLKALPCDVDDDTIYAIEHFSFMGDWLYLMYWSQKFLYSAEGYFGDTLKVYGERRFEKWLVEQVEEWNKDSILEARHGEYGPDGTHYVTRIVFHKGQILTDSFVFGHINTPDDYDDDIYLWEYWINNDQKEPVAIYKCPNNENK